MRFIFIPTLSSGGAEKIASSILNNSDRLEAVCFFSSESPYYINRPVKYIINSNVPNNILFRLFCYVYIFFWLVCFFNYKKCKYVQSHLHTTSILVFLARKLSIRKIVHDSVLHGRLKVEKRKGGVYFNLLLLAYKNCRYVVCVSNGVIDECSQFALTNTKLILNGLSFIPSRSRERSHQKKMLCVGRLSKVKRMRDVILAMKGLDEDISLDIYGGGQEFEELNNLVLSLNLNHRVRIFGFVNNLAETYKSYDVMVSCSESETFSLALLESLVCATPVISSNCEYGPKELLDVDDEKYFLLKDTFLAIEGKGIVYQVGDVLSLIKSIDFFFDNRNQFIIRDELVSYLIEKYSNKKMLESYLLLERL
ncbi:glycosyltransferase [Vibrio splendidus]